MSAPPIVPWVCQPQYWVRNPLVSVTSLLVSTKYTPLVSFGSRPLVIALGDDRLDRRRRSGAVPCE